MEQVKVLQVIGSMNIGGAETMLMNIYRNIDRERVHFDFVVQVNEPAAFDEEIESMGGKIYRCPRFNGINYFEYKKWWKQFFVRHNGEYSVIHGHIGSSSALYLKEGKSSGCFTVAHSHNTYGRLCIKNVLFRIAVYNTRYIADYFFACSKAAGKERFGRKIVDDADRFMLVNNAVDTEKFDFSEAYRNDIRDEFGISGDAVLFGHIGRFDEQKNHAFLIEIFHGIYKKEPKARLILVGDGKNRRETEKRALALNMEKAVVFAEIRSDVNKIIQAMDVFLLPSLYEGFPLVLVEAQTSGLPCLISDKVPRECILAEDIITVLSLSDSVEKWADAALKAAKTKRSGKRKLMLEKGFDVKETAERMENFYVEKSK